MVKQSIIYAAQKLSCVGWCQLYCINLCFYTGWYFVVAPFFFFHFLFFVFMMDTNIFCMFSETTYKLCFIYTVFCCVESIETDLYVIYICCRRYKLRSNLNAYQHWMKLKSRKEEKKQQRQRQQKQPKPKPKPKNHWRWEKEKSPILSSSSIHPEKKKKKLSSHRVRNLKRENWHCQLLVGKEKYGFSLKIILICSFHIFSILLQ